MRNRFDKELVRLNDSMIEMGSLCEAAIDKALKALADNDTDLAKEAMEDDANIDEMERDIEQQCYVMLLSQQPVARDLRNVSAALKMITDMERIGDQATDIAEIAVTADLTAEFHNLELDTMAKVASKMVNAAVDAYVQKDLDTVHSVYKQDDIVDQLFDKISAHIIHRIENKEIEGAKAVEVLMIAKYLERIGDHAVNIGEWVEFSITGEHPKN
ncbi:MAG: phosphate transport system regulatory protein PhoU [Eubacteriaceae bacterium]|uniref:Phosphate-specific transport system accessory protein PhoU n=1 Tax=Candidatus Pseudoramibacter fermentans TaxID=2594427 RepID=A0A6L5GSW2_9FIRM|nr:phosphate signaling complex protein PhoU [Candidatus Pseudoramibacter fermentans]RRF93023.1 MAG: phosphate transport system regulatory protein PhoU [Eubacteriaceae bacterium]